MRARSLALAALAIAGALVGAEIVARVTAPPVRAAAAPGPVLARISATGPSGGEAGGRALGGVDVGGSAGFRTNALGYRGLVPASPRPPRALRVAVAGGPFAFGRSLADARTVAARTQALLVKNVSDRAIEAVSVGPGGRSRWTGEALLGARVAFDVDPDVVVWIAEPESAVAHPWAVIAPPSPPLALLRWLGASAAEVTAPSGDPAEAPAESLAFGTVEWARARDDLARALARRDALPAREAAPGSLLSQEMRFDADEVVRLATRIHAETERRGLRLVVAVLPHPLEADAELRALLLDALAREEARAPSAAWTFDDAARLAGSLRAAGVTTIDLTQILREALEKRLANPLDVRTGRWNGEAASFAAAAIASLIVSSGAAGR